MRHLPLTAAFGAFVLMAGLVGPTLPAAAQPAPPAPVAPEPPQAPQPQTVVLGDGFVVQGEGRVANETRSDLARILRQYSPALREILARDPSLLENAGYMEPYPALSAFLAQHPEIVRNPSFYFGDFFYRQRSLQQEALDLMTGVLAGLALLTGFSILASLLVWIVRGIIDHRRWSRLLATQVALHTKLADRLTTDQQVLDYAKSPAVARFLESGPMAEGGPARPWASTSRVIWPLQGGIVLLALGLGLWLVRGRVMAEVASGFDVMGIIVMMLGLGFVASAAVAFVMSSQLGLFSRDPRS